MLRKKNKLPAETHAVDFELEYGTATIEVHKDSIDKGDSVLIIDDLIATGGTAKAAAKLVEMSGGNVVAFVPQGTGLMIMANESVEVFHNKIFANDTANVLIVSYHMTGKPINDENYVSYARSVYVHDNDISLSGRNPIGGAAEASKDQVEALKFMLGGKFPDFIYDGYGDSENHDNTKKICFKTVVV